MLMSYYILLSEKDYTKVKFFYMTSSVNKETYQIYEKQINSD